MPLRGRSLVAKLDDQAIAVILLHYEHDTSNLLRFLQGKQIMVIDATTVCPSIAARSCCAMVEAGIKQRIIDLAEYHSMRVVL